MAYMRQPEYDAGGRTPPAAPTEGDGSGMAPSLRSEEKRATRQEIVTARATAGGSALELLGGAGAGVLAIIGLTGILPFYMASIATIACGGALLIHGASIAARWQNLMRELEGGRYESVDLGSGASAEILGGCAAIALGILALVGVIPAILLPVSAIVLGVSVLMAGAAEPAFVDLQLGADMSERARRAANEAVKGSAASQVIAGLGAGVLGILAVIGVGPALTLVLVSMLAIGSALLLGGGALVARFAKALT